MAYSAKTNAPGPRRRKRIFLILACVLFLALVFLSFLPTAEKSELHTMGRFHTLGHVLAFAVLAYVMVSASRSRQTRILFFCMTLTAGFAIELGEHLVFGSVLEWKDIAADSIGVLLGAAFALIAASRTARAQFRT